MRSLRPCAELAIVALTGVGGLPSVAFADGWTLTPRIAGQELATDNLLATASHTRSDLVTTLSPGFSLTENSERVQGTLDYSPTLFYYAFTPGQNTIGHNLYANGTATVVPDFAFFDVRAFAAMQPTTPGLTTSPIATTPSIIGPVFTNVSGGLPSVQLTQDFSFSASPYIGRRFDDFGAAELRYAFSDTQFNNNNSKSLSAVPTGFATQSSSSNRTNEITGTFNTGERFGLYEGRLLLDGAKSSGAGAINQSSSYVATIDSAYRVTPRIAPLSTVGYEALQFSGFPPIRINGVIWGIGVRLTPSPDATITVRYGHANGITAPNFDVLYHVTGRTTISANYSEGLSTLAQQIANNLAVSLLDADHQPVDSRTLLPLSIVNSTSGVQSGLFHNKQLGVTVKTDWERDHVALSIFDSNNAIVSQTTAGSGISQKSLAANFTWGHDLTSNTTINSGLGYSHSSFGSPTNSAFGSLANSTEDLLSVSASITEQFAPSLSGTIGYSFLDRFSPNPQLRLTNNIVYASLRKEF